MKVYIVFDTREGNSLYVATFSTYNRADEYGLDTFGHDEDDNENWHVEEVEVDALY